jgi:hypothetical protein
MAFREELENVCSGISDTPAIFIRKGNSSAGDGKW